MDDVSVEDEGVHQPQHEQENGSLGGHRDRLVDALRTGKTQTNASQNNECRRGSPLQGSCELA